MRENLHEKLHDIYDLWHIPFWSQRWFSFFLFLLIVFSVSFLLFIVVRQRRSQKIVLTPGQWALLELQGLASSRCVTSERAQEFYLRLTEILKQYVQKRYKWVVLGKTDAEFMQFLHNEGVSFVLLQELQEVFSGMQEVKFARAHALFEQVERDLQRAIFFVEQATLLEGQSNGIVSPRQENKDGKQC